MSIYGYLSIFIFLFWAAACARAEDLHKVINRGLPSWVDLGVQTRFRAEGQHGLGFQSDNDTNFLNQRYRLGLAIKPAHWLTFYGQVQDARAAGMAAPDSGVKDTIDLRQAYVDIGHEQGWWDLKVGRQMIFFGSERVIGASEWGNTARVFDAARLGVHHGSDRVDIFASSVVQNDMDHWDHHQQGNNLHGIYASLGSPIPGFKLEPYVLLRTAARGTGDAGRIGRMHTYTWGVRGAGVYRKAWTVEAEAIRQSGSIANSNLAAWAATLQLQRRFFTLRWSPSLLAETNYASGDRSRGDNVVNTFDQLYPTNHGIYGIADQIGRRNNQNIRGGLWLRPRKWLTVKSEGHSFWLASACDALYQYNGAITVPAVAGCATDTHIGNELDFLADIKVSKFYDIGAQYGHLFPGEFLNRYSKHSGRTFYAFFIDFKL